MSPEEENLISAWHDGLLDGVSMTCIVSKDDRTDTFKTFCEALSRVAPNVSVTYEKADDSEAPPALEIHKGLNYHAIPRGRELAPFLDVLSRLGSGGPPLPETGASELENLKTPCFLKLFIAPDCPFCSGMVEALAPLALASDLVTLTVIDGLLFPEMAEPNGVKSAPTLLLDDRVRWSGRTPLSEILDVMLNQDPSLLSAASMEALLGDGRADLLARMMMGEGKIFPAFMDMLVHEKWPVRLGAMVVMEEIIEADGGLAAACVAPLWERFPRLNDQVRGDVAYILGEAGTGEMIPRLKAALEETTHKEIREAINEAIQTLSKKC